MFERIKIGSAILHDLDLLKHITSAYFNFIYIIRFVLLLAFQCRISNCSTAKTRKVAVRAVENNEEKQCHVPGWGGDGVLVEPVSAVRRGACFLLLT